jgi:hypothetical protein
MPVIQPITSSSGTFPYVPNTRTLSINGVTYDLSADRSWTISTSGTGTVTSVALSATMPTGLVASISGSPITSNGTLGLTITMQSGYSIPTNTKQSNWDDAYTFVGNFPSQSGNSGKYLTTNGSVLSWATLDFSNITGTVPVSKGGTGATSLSGVVIGNGTSAFTTASSVTSGQLLRVNTLGTGYEFFTPSFLTAIDILATSPLVWNSGTKTMSIPVATNSANGYLSSADWLTFSSKQNAITLTTTGNNGSATLVGATLNIPTYTLVGLGGMSNPFSTGIGQIIYSNGAGAPLSLAPNTTTTKKFLAMTGDGTNGDAPFWDTITSGVSGTTNYVAKFTSSSAVGNSIIFDNGTNVGIGNNNPNVALDVTGEIAIRGGESPDDARMYFRASDNSNRFIIETDFDSNANNDLLGFRSFANDNILVLKGGGDVSIGTNSASGRLHVQGSTTGTSLYLTDAVNSTLYITHPSTGRTSFYNGTNTRWLTESGAVVGLEGSLAVGGIVANAKLQISGGSLATGGSGTLISSGLTNGRLETYQSGTANCIHTWLDNNTYEISAGSTAGYVSGLVITGRDASLLPDRVAIYTRSLQRFQIGSLGQLQLNSYTSATSFTGTPVAYLACDSSGNIITSNPAAGRSIRIAFSAEVPNTWANMPNTLQFFDSSSAYVTQIDLTDYNQVRLIVNKQGTAGATGSKLLVRYQATTGTPFDETLYSAIGSSEVSVAVDTTNTIITSSWINLVSGAKADVWVALMGIDGDTTADPVFGNIYAEFRYNP